MHLQHKSVEMKTTTIKPAFRLAKAVTLTK